ncbi:MAG: alpha/beta hydrolase [Rhizobiales bacterium]|nr:alpha/beta hydrolase [Hyphomicrobiales bacterium]
MSEEKALTFDVEGSGTVSGLLILPPKAKALYVLAHCAGAGMRQRFLEATARGLERRGIGTLRYQFPYMEKGSKRPDRPPVAFATVRAAVAEAARLAPKMKLVAGGKSFGGRMTSGAEAEAHLAGIAGLVFLGFPLHPPGAPADTRGAHLSEVTVPMLFLQGTGDEFAEMSLLRPLVERLAKRATLHLVEAADHSFHVPAKSGRKDAEVLDEILDVMAAWIERL